mmetsp:Transcript_53992/g.167337  ORF Transcript_53992/g.167337 Transcript_53992/m.167337 type:complete len:635 (-) Transcript_53992:696-2600(-)
MHALHLLDLPVVQKHLKEVHSDGQPGLELLPHRGHRRPALQRLQDPRDGLRVAVSLHVRLGLHRPVGHPVLRGDDQQVELAEEVVHVPEDLRAKVVLEVRLPAIYQLEFRIALLQQLLALCQVRLCIPGGRLHGLQVAVEESLVAVLDGTGELSDNVELELHRRVPARHAVDDGLDEDGEGDGADLLVAGLEGAGEVAAAGGQQLVDAKTGDEAAHVAPHRRDVVRVGEEKDVQPRGRRLDVEANGRQAGEEGDPGGDDDRQHLAQHDAQQPVRVLVDHGADLVRAVPRYEQRQRARHGAAVLHEDGVRGHKVAKDEDEADGQQVPKDELQVFLLEHPLGRPSRNEARQETPDELLAQVLVPPHPVPLLGAPRDALAKVRHLPCPEGEGEREDVLLRQVHGHVRRGLVEGRHELPLLRLDRIHELEDVVRFLLADLPILASSQDREHQLLRHLLQRFEGWPHLLAIRHVVALEVLVEDAPAHAVHHVPDVGRADVILRQEPACGAPTPVVHGLPPSTLSICLRLVEAGSEARNLRLNLEALRRAHPAAHVLQRVLPNPDDGHGHGKGVLIEVPEVRQRQAGVARQGCQDGNEGAEPRGLPHRSMAGVREYALPRVAVLDAYVWVHEVHHEANVP